MKKFKKFAALMAAAALMVTLPAGNSLTAYAAEPTTFYAYVGDEGDWLYQVGTNCFNEDLDEEDIEDLEDDIKNGDILVVNGIGDSVNIDVSKVYLSNLTIINADIAIIATAGVGDCHVVADVVASVSGNVNNAYVYENARVTFVNNVNYLELTSDDEIFADVNSGGTIGHLKAIEDGDVDYEYYNVAAGKLEIDGGDFETDEIFYSKTPTGSAPAPAPSAPAQSSSSNSGSNELDSVPKTGEAVPAYVWLFGIAVVCMGCKKALKRA